MIQGALARLARMGGKELALELLDRFLEESPGRLTACGEAAAAQDGKTLELHLHRLSSDAGWLGGARTQGLASQLESLATQQKYAEVAARLDELSGLCYDLVQELERERIIWLESVSP